MSTVMIEMKATPDIQATQHRLAAALLAHVESEISPDFENVTLVIGYRDELITGKIEVLVEGEAEPVTVAIPADLRFPITEVRVAMSVPVESEYISWEMLTLTLAFNADGVGVTGKFSYPNELKVVWS